ncbi:MAG: pyridine nucleotide-disulfide oxidoreductase [Frankiales bacterium]|nr:pyridine nucleotide-disulfide oxidoreductase [Frankiales bacterium]
MKVVIVGAGLAGLRTVESLRDKGFDGEIVLVGEEVHLPYDRPPLSKHVLRGERPPMYLRPEDDYTDLELTLRLGTVVTALDLAAKTVETTDGPISYDQVVIATGAIPRRLPGLPGQVLRTLDDSQALAPVLVPGARIGIVGAGLIGCEVAASARAKDVEVHVVDVLPKPLVRVLGDTVAQRVLDLHEQHGVHFHLSTGVASATSTRLELTDGTVLEVDAVLEAMGVVPATGWLEGSGLRLDDGVVCDEHGQAADGVWAVGDVARWSDGRGGSSRREHWTSATEQAVTVAAAVLGDREALTAPPYWWSDQYDVKLQGLGIARSDDDVQVVSVGPKQRPLALYSRDGRLTGVVGFSAAAFVMRLRPEVIEGAPLAEVLAALEV